MLRSYTHDLLEESKKKEKERKMTDKIAIKTRDTSIYTWLSRIFPFLAWGRFYTMNTFRGDMIAGITCGLLIIPQGIAYANLAGLPAEYGLYTAMTPGIIYCLFGTSKDVSVGPTVTMALFTYRFNATHHPIGGSALAFLVGAVLAVMAILRLGFITKFMPMHVNSGFVSAAAVVVAISQLKNLFGLPKAPASFAGKIGHFFNTVHDFNKYDLALGLGCIVFLFIFMLINKKPLENLQKKEGPVWKFLSNALWFTCIARSGIVCILGTLVSYVCFAYGPGKVFTLAGRLPVGLPPIQSPFATVNFPDNSTMTFSDFAKSFQSGLIILPVIQFIQSISIATAFSKIYHYETDSTQELIALSCANMFGAFFGGWPVTGSFSGSAVNAMSGTQTPFSSVVACGLVFVACGFLMPCFYFIPKTVLGAMIAMAVVTMIDYKTPMRIWKVRKIDMLPYLVSFFGTFYTLESGVLAGTVVALLVMISNEVKPESEFIANGDGVSATLNFKGNLSFPAVEGIKETVQAHIGDHPAVRTLNMDMGSVYHIDYAVVNSFRSLIQEMETNGVFIDFINFIDPNVEESFKKGKLQRLAADKKYNDAKNEAQNRENNKEKEAGGNKDIIKILLEKPLLNGDDQLIRRRSSMFTVDAKLDQESNVDKV